MEPPSRDIRDNPSEHRFELALGGANIAAIYYREDDAGNLVLVHTEVPFDYSGQGIASLLAEGVLELIRNSGRKAVFQCPFLSGFLAKHPEYDDLLAG